MKVSTFAKISFSFVACIGLACAPQLAVRSTWRAWWRRRIAWRRWGRFPRWRRRISWWRRRRISRQCRGSRWWRRIPRRHERRPEHGPFIQRTFWRRFERARFWQWRKPFDGFSRPGADGQWHSFGGARSGGATGAARSSGGSFSGARGGAGNSAHADGAWHSFGGARGGSAAGGVSGASRSFGARAGSSVAGRSGTSSARGFSNSSGSRFNSASSSSFGHSGFSNSASGSTIRRQRGSAVPDSAVRDLARAARSAVDFGGAGFGNRGFGGFGGRGFGFDRGFGRGFGCCGFGGFGWGFGFGYGLGFGWGGFSDPFLWGPGWGWGAPYPYYYPYADWPPYGYYPPPAAGYNYGAPYNTPDNTPSNDNNSLYGPYSSSGYGYDNTAPVVGTPDTDPITANVAEFAPAILVYMKDGTMLVADDYWVADGQFHYRVKYGGESAIGMDELDLQRTVDENAKRGVRFSLKPKPVANPDGTAASQPAAPSSPAPVYHRAPSAVAVSA